MSLFNYVRVIDHTTPIMILLKDSEYNWLSVDDVINKYPDWMSYIVKQVSIGNECINIIIDSL